MCGGGGGGGVTCAQSKGSKSTKTRAFGCLEIDTLALMYQVFSRIRRIENDVTMMVIVVRRTEQRRICWGSVVDSV